MQVALTGRLAMNRKLTEHAVSLAGTNGVPCSVKPGGAGHRTELASSTPKLIAKPVLRILSRATGEVVGYVYQWNNGERQAMWTAGRVRAVEYAPFSIKPDTSTAE